MVENQNEHNSLHQGIGELLILLSANISHLTDTVNVGFETQNEHFKALDEVTRNNSFALGIFQASVVAESGRAGMTNTVCYKPACPLELTAKGKELLSGGLAETIDQALLNPEILDGPFPALAVVDHIYSSLTPIAAGGACSIQCLIGVVYAYLTDSVDLADNRHDQ